MKTVMRYLIPAILLMTGFYAEAATSTVEDAQYKWQLRRLLKPSQYELEREAKGAVFVYQGLKDTDVEQAMDAHPERINRMMFVKVIHTDEQGIILRNPETGEPIVDDDC